MDEKAFRSTFKKVNDSPCAFNKAILRRCCACGRSEKLFIAERETIGCKSPGAQQRCAELLKTLHEKSVFVLQLTHPEQTLPHNKELKVQCGGLLGLQGVVDGEGASTEKVADIHQLIDLALERYGSLERFPFSQMVQTVNQYQPRQRSSRRSR